MNEALTRHQIKRQKRIASLKARGLYEAFMADKAAKQRAYMITVRARRKADPAFDEKCKAYSRAHSIEYYHRDVAASRAYHAKWRAQNPESHKRAHAKYRSTPEGLAREKAYALAHRAEQNAATKRWKARNKELVAARAKARCQANPAYYAMLTSRRNARKRALLHPDHNPAIERFLHERAATLSRLTKWKHCVDHIIPLACFGPHHHDNLQVMPVELNSSKNDNPFWEHPDYCSWRDVPTALWPPQLAPQYTELLQAA